MVQRGGLSSPSKSRAQQQLPRKEPNTPTKSSAVAGLFRSKTPTADMYSNQTKEVMPNRPKTPLVDTRNRSKTPNIMGNTGDVDERAGDGSDYRAGQGSFTSNS